MPDGGRQPEAPDVAQPEGGATPEAPDVVQPEGGAAPEAPDVVHAEGDGSPEAPDFAQPEGAERPKALDRAQPEPQDAPAEAAEARVAAPKARLRRKAAAAPEHWLKGADAPFAAEVQLTPVRESPATQEPGAAEQRCEPADAPAPASPLPEPPPPSPRASALRSFAARCTRARRRAALTMASLRRAARRLARAAARSRSRRARSAGEAAAPCEPRPSSPRLAPRGGGKLLLALVASNTCLLSVVLAALARDISFAEPPVSVESARAEPAAPARPAVDRQSPCLPTLAISEIVVRLRDHPADPAPLRARGRFVRIALELQFPDEDAKRAMSERLPRLRDVFRAYLSARTAQDLRGGRGIQSAKMGLLERVLETAPSVPVRGLYVSQFLLQ